MDTYPKFKEDEECAYPERKQCNYGENISRCPYMKYNNSKSIFDPSRWECTFESKKSSNNDTKTKPSMSEENG